MIKGITPIDTAFELIGLCNAQSITHYIFYGTMGGALIFIIGFMGSLFAIMTKGTLKPFFTFMIIFFTAWILFITPAVQMPSATSTMEQNGFTDLTTNQVLSGNSQTNLSNNGQINPILNIVSDLFSAFTIGCVGAIETGADPSKSNYLKNPFMVAKLATIASETLGQGIKNPQLKTEVTDFYKTYYLPTLQNLIETRAYTIADMPKLWPGDPAITALYSSQASTAWNQVKTDLLTYIQTQSGLQNAQFLNVLSTMLGQNSDDVTNAALISIFSADMKAHPNDYSSMAYQNSGYANSSNSSNKFWGNLMGNTLATAGANIFQPIAITISQSMLQMAPYIQGYALLLMFSFFPFILVIMILERRPMLLVDFLKNLFWVKSWTICWVILDVGSSYVLSIAQALNSTSTGIAGFWQGAYFNIVTAVFMIMLPILSRMMIDGVATGIGVAATAANMHADKSVDLGIRNATGAGTTAINKTVGAVGHTIGKLRKGP